ncbi:MAG: F0F1 ATP synthase subunit A [Cyanobacteria bacterium SID2]|nr:F0F1 ATP synthase subunit A [Cyanobacteria bacterium SID2]MBP0006079.1 F0F1 ATP synthase subunit A [Cyanobacteria bacterium SBC]
MEISPDNIIIDFLNVNATIAYTWLVMAILVVGSWLVTRQLTSEPQISKWQNILEVIVKTINEQIKDAVDRDPEPFLPFIGTLFLFIAVSNILTLFPVYQSPAGSLSTTIALSLCTFVAVPLFGIRDSGLIGYLKHYFEPSPWMFPFQVIGEISRIISLAVRLFGNVMSGSFLVAILLLILPLVFPAIMQLFGILIGVIQAYVFAILSLVYIASGMQAQHQTETADTIEDSTFSQNQTSHNQISQN